MGDCRWGDSLQVVHGGTQRGPQAGCMQAAVKGLGDAAAKLHTGVACVVSREGRAPQLAVLAEHVRSKADAVAKVPLDQRSAVCKVFATAGVSVQVCSPPVVPQGFRQRFL